MGSFPLPSHELYEILKSNLTDIERNARRNPHSLERGQGGLCQ